MRRLFSRSDGHWAAMYAVAFLILSLSESDILRQNSLEWILFVAASAKLVIDLASRPRLAPARLSVVRPA